MKIAIVADTHLTSRGTAVDENWAAVTAWLESDPPDLLIHLGDVTADGARDPREFAAASAAFERLRLPIRFVPGNHDIGDNPLETGPSGDHPLDLARLADFRALFGPDSWELVNDAWRLFGLNAQLFGTGTEEEERQFRWLAERVSEQEGAAVALVLHKPLFREGPADTEVHVRYVPARPRRRLLDLVASCDLRFVVSGHAHQYRAHSCDGVEHVWAPSTAYCFPDTMQERIGEKEKMVGALMLELSATAHRFALVRPPGLESLTYEP